MNKNFKKIANTKSILSWKSKGLSDAVIKSPTINNNILAPELEYINKKMFVKFNGSCLIKQNKSTFNRKIVNIYIVYDLDLNSNDFDPALQNFLFGAVKLTKNSDIDKYKYSGYGIGFDSRGTCLHSNGLGRNGIIFGTDVTSSTHTNNKTRNILVLGRDFIQGIDGTTIYAEKIYSINFSETAARFCLSLHYKRDDSYLFVNGKEMINFKAEDSEIVEDLLCLGNTSKEFSETNMKKTGLYESVSYFSVNHNAMSYNINVWVY